MATNRPFRLSFSALLASVGHLSSAAPHLLPPASPVTVATPAPSLRPGGAHVFSALVATSRARPIPSCAACRHPPSPRRAVAWPSGRPALTASSRRLQPAPPGALPATSASPRSLFLTAPARL